MDESPRRSIERFRGTEPTRDLSDWHWLWGSDTPFPVDSHRGLLGRLVVWVKRLLRPLVKAPQADLWDRQRIFNLILLESLQDRRQEMDRRVGHLENFVPRALDDLVAHNDALFTRVDQKLDRARREGRELSGRLGSALALLETPEVSGTSREAPEVPGTPVSTLGRLRSEQAYLALEERYRGTEDEIRERLAVYLPRLEKVAGRGKVVDLLDLGCGRGEALEVFAEAGLRARGVDSSTEMVHRARDKGLDAVSGDLFEVLSDMAEGSVGAVVSFHVVEHLPPVALDRLLRLALRALVPGGLLILETPNPLSVVVAARSFWLDPTHERPVHPDSLALFAREAGFTAVERLDLRPFPEDERLPEIDVEAVAPEQRELADQVNRLRDRLDEVLYGHQDYALVAEKPA
jgi:SAM-dependent methyltransferase